MIPLLGDVLLSNFELLARPYKLNLVVTKECNSKCKYCKIWKQSAENELSLFEYEKIANNVKYIKWLNVTGGEPTQREDLAEIVKIFKTTCKNFDYMNFSTNGILPEQVEKASKKIASLGIEELFINVSLDGPPEVHNSIRGVEGNFSSALETYKRLKKINNIKTSFAFTFYGENNDKLFETMRAVQAEIPDVRPEDFHLNLPQSSGHYYMNSKVKTNFDEIAASAMAEFGKLVPRKLSAVSIIEKNYRENALDIYKNKKNRFGCSSIQSSVYISEKGEVFPCTVWSKSLGSLRENNYNLNTILDEAATKGARRQIKEGKCPTCWSPCEAVQSIAANLRKVRV